MRWLQEAADQGDTDAQAALRELVGAQQNFEEMFKEHGVVHLTPTGRNAEGKQLYTVAVEFGEAAKQYKQALRYERGDGVERNELEAARLHQSAAEQGHSGAQYALAWMYEEGRGVKRDDREAVRWYRRAATQGHVRAQTALGMRHLTGVGVPRDAYEAEHWVRSAAEHGQGDPVGVALAKDKLEEVLDAKQLWKQLAEEAGVSEVEYYARQGMPEHSTPWPFRREKKLGLAATTGKQYACSGYRRHKGSLPRKAPWESGS